MQGVRPVVNTTFTEEDFCSEREYARSLGLSDQHLEDIKKVIVGSEVDEPDCTDEELKAAGYSSWKQHEVCGYIRAW